MRLRTCAPLLTTQSLPLNPTMRRLAKAKISPQLRNAPPKRRSKGISTSIFSLISLTRRNDRRGSTSLTRKCADKCPTIMPPRLTRHLSIKKGQSQRYRNDYPCRSTETCRCLLESPRKGMSLINTPSSSITHPSCCGRWAIEILERPTELSLLPNYLWLISKT